jgi:hypothetical protein
MKSITGVNAIKLFSSLMTLCTTDKLEYLPLVREYLIIARMKAYY